MRNSHTRHVNATSSEATGAKERSDSSTRRRRQTPPRLQLALSSSHSAQEIGQSIRQWPLGGFSTSSMRQCRSVFRNNYSLLSNQTTSQCHLLLLAWRPNQYKPSWSLWLCSWSLASALLQSFNTKTAYKLRALSRSWTRTLGINQPSLSRPFLEFVCCNLITPSGNL